MPNGLIYVSDMDKLSILSPLTCDYCHKMRYPRAHHCKRCNLCIIQADHHCSWLGTCIGYSNLRYFLCFLLHLTCALSLILFYTYDTPLLYIQAVY